MKSVFSLFCCSAPLFCSLRLRGKTLLNKKKPVSLSFWHVYGEQAGSPMDLLVQEFNRTVGQERGVQVKVTGTSSASQIGGYLKEAQSGGQEVQEMPDLFTCHIVDALELGEDNLVDWNEQFTADELSDFVPGFLDDGTVEDGRLLVLPVSKSTQLLMCNGSGFDRFSAATGVRYDDLATWEAFTTLPANSMTGRASPSVRWTIPSAPWSSAPWSAAAGISTRKTAGTIPTMPYLRRAGCSSPDPSRRAMWWSLTSTPTPR